MTLALNAGLVEVAAVGVDAISRIAVIRFYETEEFFSANRTAFQQPSQETQIAI
jgi:hypothetical protein